MKTLPDGGVDMVLADLPYGTTANKWDSVIPLDQLWAAWKRICKPGAAIVLTASQPFTSALVSSNPKAFRYEWIWTKSHVSGHLNAKKRPLLRHESVLVFCDTGLPTYRPQMQTCTPFETHRGQGTGVAYQTTPSYGKSKVQPRTTSTERYPTTLLPFASCPRPQSVHPTQKPVPLCEYLIRTYSNPGDVVLDCTMGSGTTGVAALNTGRSFVGIEKNTGYFAVASERIIAAHRAASQATQECACEIFEMWSEKKAA